MLKSLQRNTMSEFFKDDLITLITFDKRFSEANSSIAKRIISNNKLAKGNIIVEWAPFDWIEFPLEKDNCSVTVKCKRKQKNDAPFFSFYYNENVFYNHYQWWEDNQSIIKKPIRNFLHDSYDPEFLIQDNLLNILKCTLFLKKQDCKILNLLPNVIIQHENYRDDDKFISYVKQHDITLSIQKHSKVLYNFQPDTYW